MLQYYVFAFDFKLKKTFYDRIIRVYQVIYQNTTIPHASNANEIIDITASDDLIINTSQPNKRRRKNTRNSLKTQAAEIPTHLHVQLPFGSASIRYEDIRPIPQHTIYSNVGLTISNTDIIRTKSKMLLNDTIVNFEMERLVALYHQNHNNSKNSIDLNVEDSNNIQFDDIAFMNSNAYDILHHCINSNSSIVDMRSKINRIFKKIRPKKHLIIPMCFNVIIIKKYVYIYILSKFDLFICFFTCRCIGVWLLFVILIRYSIKWF